MKPKVRVGLSIAALLVGLDVGAATAQGDLPWIEREDLTLNTPAPTSVERLLDAEVLIVADYDLEPDPVGGGWWLLVDPWTTLRGTFEEDDPDLCQDPPGPFYGQPTSGRLPTGQNIAGCSGFLVAPNLVVTAGHCIAPVPPADPWTGAPYGCENRYVVFDFANEGPVPPTTNIHLDAAQVVRCDTVLVDTYQGSIQELPSSGLGGGGPDGALLQLAPDPAITRLPLVVERSSLTQAGDPILVLGHPARIPTKAELATATGASSARLHMIQGNSGSPMISLKTGKVFANVTSGGTGWWSEDPVLQCIDLCFECPGITTSGTNSLAWLAHVPPLGLQVSVPPSGLVEYYGPPTTALDYAPCIATVSVPAASLPQGIDDLSWAVQQEDHGPQFFEVVSGPSSGTLEAGAQETLELLPSDWLVGSPGVYEKVMPFFDFTYGTREPITHRASVGVDGFTVFPATDFDGEGLGVPHGTVRTSIPVNRWITTQDLTASASHSWIRLDGNDGTIPVPLTLPPTGTKAPEVAIDVSTDGAGMAPGVYTGTVTFRSDDSGSPAYKIEQEVRFDHCRELYEDTYVPQEITLAAFGGLHEEGLLIQRIGVSTISDVDVVAAVTTGTPTEAKFSLTLRSPDGTEVLLKGFGDPSQTYYDDETYFPPSFDELEDFDGRTSIGPWALVIQNDLSAANSLTVDLTRFEIRLHHENAPLCVP